MIGNLVLRLGCQRRSGDGGENPRGKRLIERIVERLGELGESLVVAVHHHRHHFLVAAEHPPEGEHEERETEKPERESARVERDSDLVLWHAG